MNQVEISSRNNINLQYLLFSGCSMLITSTKMLKKIGAKRNNHEGEVQKRRLLGQGYLPGHRQNQLVQFQA